MTIPRVGLVGLGDAGRHHGRALMELERRGKLLWTAACARDPGRAVSFLAQLNAPAETELHASLKDLLDAGTCDAVILATPDGLHADQIAACAARGVHVLAEKPLALSVPEGCRAVDAARKGDIVLSVGYHLRHHAGHQLARRRLYDLIGPLRTIEVRWAWPDPAAEGWRARRDNARFWSLAALGTHAVDLALWFAGTQVDGKSVLTVPNPRTAVDRGANISLRFTSGVLASLSVSVMHRAQSRFSLVGDRGEIVCLGTLGAAGTGTIALHPARGTPQWLQFHPCNPYEAQLEAFASRVHHRAPAEMSEALLNLAILDSADA